MSTSPQSATQALDPLMESMLDLSEYESKFFDSPAVSPVTSKTAFTKPTPTTTPASLLSTTQPLSGPSHQYELYKQQTGIVPGALATTFAINENNSQITGYSGYNLDLLGVSSQDDMFDFNAAPSQGSMTSPDMEMDFESPTGDASLFFPETINPSAIASLQSPTLPSPPAFTQPTRVYPGMHQQAALAKAQAQQRQQQQLIQQQRQNAQAQQSKAQQQRNKSSQPTDPIVEQKITQLLNSMRAKPASPESTSDDNPMLNLARAKKDEEDMDEDERLLASEEGKKLSSKERRQLRNKVSARAFRSRRKEYIGQLEAEITQKVNENGDLRAQNRALVEENKRLSDLTRMLLSSPSFSDFLDRLSSNAAQMIQPPAPQPQVAEPRREARQIPKDINPYTAQQQLNGHQQIGMAMIPEQSLDMSMLGMGGDAFYEPQVFTVETPEIHVPEIDTSLLSGKTSNFVGPMTIESDDEQTEKVDMPVIAHPVESEPQVKDIAVEVIDEDFENDPAFALYHESTFTAEHVEPAKTRELDVTAISDVEIFGGVETEKALARYELVNASEEEVKQAEEALVAAKVERIVANLEAISSRLDMLRMDDS